MFCDTIGSVAAQSGEANTASNLGAGVGVFNSKAGVDLEFKSLTAGTGITLTPSATEILIETSAEANTASNLGTGEGVFAQKNLVDLEFKSLTAGAGITITPSATELLFATTAEANTASNLGTGEGVFAQKSTVDLQFKSLKAGTNITLTPSATEILIDAAGGGGTQSGAKTRIAGQISGFGLGATLIPLSSGVSQFDTDSYLSGDSFTIPETAIYTICFYCYSPTNSNFVTAYYKLNSNDPTGSIGFAPTIYGGSGGFATTSSTIHLSLTAGDLLYFFAYAPQGQIGNVQISVVKA